MSEPFAEKVKGPTREFCTCVILESYHNCEIALLCNYLYTEEEFSMGDIRAVFTASAL